MNIIIYEDNKIDDFKPFTLNHATFELQSGMLTNLERIFSIYGEKNEYILFVREEIEDIIRFRFPEHIVNPKTIPNGKYINGRFLLKDEIDLNLLPDIPSNDDLIEFTVFGISF